MVGKVHKIIEWVGKELWECEHCGCIFTSKKAAELHEETCIFNMAYLENLKNLLVKIKIEEKKEDKKEGE